VKARCGLKKGERGGGEWLAIWTKGKKLAHRTEMGHLRSHLLIRREIKSSEESSSEGQLRKKKIGRRAKPRKKKKPARVEIGINPILPTAA